MERILIRSVFKGYYHVYIIHTIHMVTVKEINQMKQKYRVSCSGTKNIMAAILWRVSRSTINTEDLEKIVDLLPNDQQEEAQKLMKDRKDKPITDYKGMWKKKTMDLDNLSRSQIKKKLQEFRDAWENITTRDTDLSDELLDTESLTQMRSHLHWYYSDEGKLIAEEWLRG